MLIKLSFQRSSRHLSRPERVPRGGQFADALGRRGEALAGLIVQPGEIDGDALNSKVGCDRSYFFLIATLIRLHLLDPVDGFGPERQRRGQIA